MGIVLFICSNCKKDTQPGIEKLPIVITYKLNYLPPDTITCGGTITDQGTSPVTARGVCWSTSVNPTTLDNHTEDGSGIGTFQSKLTGLNEFTAYYVRAYATNRKGTAYAQDTVKFTMPSRLEGFYASTGRIHKLTSWDRTWSANKHLSAVDATTFGFLIADIALPATIQIDPHTYEVTSIINTELTYTLIMNTLSLNLDGQGGDSHYDPATKEFYLYYYYVGTENLDRVITEILVKE